jgi:ornithine cyclodeaminase
VDRRESAFSEAGDILIAINEGAITPDHVVAEIGELLIGSSEGRRTADEITLFKSLGLAIEDLASAHYLYAQAKRERAGTWVEFGNAASA